MDYCFFEKKEYISAESTRMSSILLVITFMLLLLVLPLSASAADMPDQTSGAGDPGGTYRAHGLAQSFTAGETGYLNQIDLYMVDYGSSGIVFTLSIYEGQSVSGTVLASATFGSSNIPYNPGGWMTVLFDQPAQVQAGQQYTMHLTSSIGDTPQSAWKLYTTDVYPGGRAYTDSNWSNYDMGFTTYVGNSPRDFTTTLSVSPVTGTYGQTVTISATLTTPEGPLAGKRVAVYLDGSSIGFLTTNAAGIGSGTYSLRQAAGSYDLKVAIAATYPYPATEQSTTLTVNKAPLTATPNDMTRPYGNSNGEFTMSFSGLMSWDTAVSLGQPVYISSANSSSPIGNYDIMASGLTSTKYEISYSPGTLTVVPASLNVTASDQYRVYGQSNPVLKGSITGLVNGDTIQADYSTAANESSQVGNYPIVPTLSDPDGKLVNYQVKVESGNLSITKADIHIVPDSFSRWYGKANPQLTGNITGVLADDNITAQYETVATQQSTEGDYDIIAQLSDPLNRLSNYSVLSDKGKLTIYAVPKPIFAAGDTETAVKSNVTLPSTDAAGNSILWTSSNNSVFDATTGEVHRPNFLASDANITLEVMVNANQATYNVTYNLTIVAAEMLDDDAVSLDKSLLAIGFTVGEDAKHVRNNLTLPTVGKNGSTITWTSSRTELINPTSGSVTRPSNIQGDQTVMLTATVTKGLKSDSRQFQLIVLKNSQIIEESEQNNEPGGYYPTPEQPAPTKPVPTPEEPKQPQPTKPSMTFSDIPKNHWAREMIEKLAEKGIIKGYTDGSFRPNEPISRMHVAVLLTRAFSLEPMRQADDFSDVPFTHPYYEEIATLQQAGIVDGAKGAFRPTENMTRAQLAKVLVGVLGLTPAGTSSFADVNSTHWSAGYIAVLEREGIALGDNGNFRPNEPVTRAQFVTFLYRIMQMER